LGGGGGGASVPTPSVGSEALAELFASLRLTGAGWGGGASDHPIPPGKGLANGGWGGV